MGENNKGCAFKIMEMPWTLYLILTQKCTGQAGDFQVICQYNFYYLNTNGYLR
jgi:hypothetical protein